VAYVIHNRYMSRPE